MLGSRQLMGFENACRGNGPMLGQRTISPVLLVHTILLSLVDWKWFLLCRVVQIELCWNHAVLRGHGMLTALGALSRYVACLMCLCDCWINFHHNIDGNSSLHMHRPEILWFLKVWIALSAAFTLWSYGVTNCTFMFSLPRYVFIALVDKLSMKLYTGLNPLFDKYVMCF